MTDHEKKVQLLGDLLLDAVSRRDALTINDDLREKRLAWIKFAHVELTATFGNCEVLWGFNNPDHTGSFESYDQAADALEVAKAEYDRDIAYFRSVRSEL
ncbi:MAG TPA: hypothetical protein VMB25_19895 [Bryobacteraceae bacterium]|nr:hypothetical protein [Bryobacteraceae bacterium]